MKLFVALSMATGAWAFTDAREAITEVIDKLNVMMENSKVDGDKEKELYAKFKCWCDSNTEEKTNAINANTKLIAQKEALITELLGSTGKLSMDVAQLTADMEENEQARKKAQSIRDKAREAFEKEETDLMEAIDSMQQALTTLAGVGADQTAGGDSDHDQVMGRNTSFLNKRTMIKVGESVKRALTAASSLVDKSQKVKIAALVQAPFTGTYTSQSGEIMGILKNMHDTFQENLEEARATEQKAVSDHEKFMEAKRASYATMEGSLTKKNGQLAKNDSDLAAAREVLKTAEEELAADQAFLEDMTQGCQAKKEQYEERKMLRSQEEAAVSEAISVLNSDEAFGTFGKKSVGSEDAAVDLNFLQLKKHSLMSKRRSVLRRLLAEAQRTKSMNLARIAVLLQQTPEEAVDKEEYVGPFAKVLSAIDDMLNVIQVEGAEDEKKHSWCETTRSEKRDERDTAKVNMDELTDTLIPGVEGEIEQLKKDIQDAQNKLTENQEEQATATADRKDANVVYHQTITDATQAQRILGKAINILTAYYAKIAPKPTRESFAQQPVDTMSEAPETFEGAYTGRSEGGNTVIGLLDSLLQDVREEEGRDHEAEIESQHAYEDNMNELTNIQETLENTLIQKNENLADKNSELTRKKERLTKETETWETTKAYLASIKEGCDFMKDNIDFRRKNREGEKEALNFAKTELKGTPAHKDAVTEHEQLLLGECKDTCNKDGHDYATCKACLAKVTVPAYCAGHPEVMGC